MLRLTLIIVEERRISSNQFWFRPNLHMQFMGAAQTLFVRLRHGGKTRWIKAMKRHNRIQSRVHRKERPVVVGPMS